MFGVESEGPVSVHLLDVAADEWAADLATGAGEAPPSLRRTTERAAAKMGSAGWSLIVLDAAFEARAGDASALRGWEPSPRRSGAPLLANAGPSLAGANSAADLDDPARWKQAESAFEDAWSSLRRGPRASGLEPAALPRVLARAPYGALTDPIETLPFEEAADDPGDFGLRLERCRMELCPS